MLSTLYRPRYLKEADLFAKNARKLLHRKRDLLSDEQFNGYASQIDELESVTHNGAATDRQRVEDTVERIDKNFGKLQPARSDIGWRENCEVLLVAFVLAIAIRAYFLQPFKIPTGSMEPTLNGIVAHPIPVDQPLPGAVRQLFESLWLGRTYVDAVSAVDDQVVDLIPEKHFVFLSYTRIVCQSGRTYLVHAPPETLTHRKDSDGFGVYPHRFLQDGRSLMPGYVGRYRAGEPIAHGYVATGDQVFVDKFTYNFRFPHRSDVFVFSTRDIAEIPMDDPNVKSQFYIKRLAGVPGDQMSINQPRLYINGGLAREPGFQRVMSGQNGYRGYSNTVPPRLTTPDDMFTVPPNSYFALGDNSFNSSDSRHFGVVPAANVIGRGLFVYWPFTRHWGSIH